MSTRNPIRDKVVPPDKPKLKTAEQIQALYVALKKKYTEKELRQIIMAYLKLIRQGLGTHRPVELKHIGELFVDVGRPYKRFVRPKDAPKTCLALYGRWKFTNQSRASICKALMQLNHIREASDKFRQEGYVKGVSIIPKRGRM